jgi:hypothetical protein
MTRRTENMNNSRISAFQSSQYDPFLSYLQKMKALGNTSILQRVNVEKMDFRHNLLAATPRFSPGLNTNSLR